MKKHRNIKIGLAVLFALFTYFQFNDPDPWLWVSIYGLLTVTCSLSAFVKIPKAVFYLFYAGLGVYGFILIPEIINWLTMGMPSIVSEMKAEEPHIEYTREFFGLVISLVSVYYLQRKNVE